MVPLRYSARSSLSLLTSAQIQRCAEAWTEGGQSVCLAWAVARDEVVASDHAPATAALSLPCGGGKASVSLTADHIFNTSMFHRGGRACVVFFHPRGVGS